jgi:hypothetical protein
MEGKGKAVLFILFIFMCVGILWVCYMYGDKNTLGVSLFFIFSGVIWFLGILKK